MTSVDANAALGRDKRHHVPAALIGHFAEQPVITRLRNSKVAVHRFAPGTTFLTRAENVGFGRDLYRGSMFDGFDNDAYFAPLERNALQPVDVLDASPSGALPANEWVKVAAYITSQFTRTPDLERSRDQLAVEGGWPRHQMDVGYPLNTQRVASAVLRARWESFRSDHLDLILNDRAISGLRYGDWDMFGYFVPCGSTWAFDSPEAPIPNACFGSTGPGRSTSPLRP